jgi:pterin-4a-carbinolamine dehydratase
LFAAMPPSSKLPRADYGTKGIVGLFASKLMDISTYAPLQSDVFQHFKEMGNTIAFLNMLDIASKSCEIEQTLFAAPFTGVTARNLTTAAGSADFAQASPFYATVHEFAQSVSAHPKMVNAQPLITILSTSAISSGIVQQQPDQHNLTDNTIKPYDQLAQICRD